MSEIIDCHIWPGQIVESHDRLLNGKQGVVIYSDHAGGVYAITESDIPNKLNDLDDQIKARLTTLLVDHRRFSEETIPVVTGELVTKAKEGYNLTIFQRADRLLRFLASL